MCLERLVQGNHVDGKRQYCCVWNIENHMFAVTLTAMPQFQINNFLEEQGQSSCDAFKLSNNDT